MEYEVVREFPEPPPHLKEDGADLWKNLGQQIIASGFLQVVDLCAFEQLCYAWQRWRAKCRDGLAISPTEDTALVKLFAEFGLTPSSRRRFGAASAPPPPVNRFAGHGKKPGG